MAYENKIHMLYEMLARQLAPQITQMNAEIRQRLSAATNDAARPPMPSRGSARRSTTSTSGSIWISSSTKCDYRPGVVLSFGRRLRDRHYTKISRQIKPHGGGDHRKGGWGCQNLWPGRQGTARGD
jgi:hypothetical protein